MKRLFKILILTIVATICAVGLFACENGGNGDGKTGLLYKMYDGDDYYTVYGYVKEDGVSELNIGDYNKDGVVIKRIKTGAFKNNDSLSKIVVPDTVETIDGGAFANMKALEELDLPFVGKTAVADVYFNSTDDSEATVKSVGNERNFGYVFGTEEYDGGVGCSQNYDASNTSTYYIPETLKKVVVSPKADLNYGIPMYAFAGNAWVSEIVLSENVKSVGEAAFKDNVYAATVNLGKIETLYDKAFNGAKNITAADLTGLTAMGSECFTNCISLKTVSINTDIKADTFSGCTALKTITMGSGVSEIGARAFNGSSNLTEITVEGTNYWTVGEASGVSFDAESVKNATYSVLVWTR